MPVTATAPETATVPLIGTGVARSCVSVSPPVLTVPDTGTGVARNCVSVSPPVVTVPLTGTGVARSWVSVSGPETATVPAMLTGWVACQKVPVTATEPVIDTAPETGIAVWFDAITTGNDAAISAWPATRGTLTPSPPKLILVIWN